MASPDISFTCIDAAAVKADYEVALGDADALTLALEDPKEALVLLMAVVPEDPSQMTAQSRGAADVHQYGRGGCTYGLDSTQYPLKFPVFPQCEIPNHLSGRAHRLLPNAHSFRSSNPPGLSPQVHSVRG